MADTLLTPTEILSETLMMATDQMPAVMNCNRQYSKEFGQKGKKIGASVTYRKPVEFSVGTAMEIDVQDVTETSDTITIDQVTNIAFDFESSDLTLTIDEFRDRYIDKAAARVAHEVEKYVQQEMGRGFINYAGTAGTTPATSGVIGDVREALKRNLAPVSPGSPYTMIINSSAENELVDALAGRYNNAADVSLQNQTGAMKRLLGFDFYCSDLVYRHTVGDHDASFLVNGASQTGTTLNADGLDASVVLKDGDKFTAVKNAVHPQTKQNLGTARQFTLTADATANGSGEIALSVLPTMDATGAYATLSALLANDAAITMLGTANTVYPYNLGYHKDSTVFVTAALPIPENVWGAQETYKGVTMQIVKDFDIKTRREIYRLDIIYGVKIVKPEWGCVLIG